jgi:WD40 repeat protein
MKPLFRSLLLCASLLLAGDLCAQDIRVTPYAALRTKAEESISALAFSASGRLLLTGDAEGNVACWDLEKRSVIAEASAKHGVVFLSFLTGDKSYVAVDAAGGIVVINILRGTADVAFRTRAKPLKTAIDAGRRFLAVATKDEHVELYDLQALMPAGSIDAGDKLDDILFLGFDRLGAQLVAITNMGDVMAWNPATLKKIRDIALAGGELHGSQSVVHAAASNRAANVFAVDLEEVALPKGGIQSGRDLERRESIVAYEWASGIEVKKTKTSGAARVMALGPGNDHVAIAFEDEKQITMVDLRKGETGSAVATEEEVQSLAVAENDRWLAAGCSGGHLAVWQLAFAQGSASGGGALPSLSGRIRSRSGTDPALPKGIPVKLALLTFEGKGVGQEIADICMSSLANSLANVDYVTLVERKQIEGIIKEQRFQVSGLTEEQGVRVGRLLNADMVLIGSIGRLGSSMVFSARLISVESGKVVRGREVVCEECRDQDIYDAISTLAATIAQ